MNAYLHRVQTAMGIMFYLLTSLQGIYQLGTGHAIPVI